MKLELPAKLAKLLIASATVCMLLYLIFVY